MLKRLFFVTAMLLPFNSTFAQTYFDPDYADPYEYADSTDDDSIVLAKKFLTPSERGQLAVMQARAEQREAQWLAEIDKKAEDEAAREAAWRSQCILPWLAVGCPPKAGT